MRHAEHDEQCWFVQWCRAQPDSVYPDLDLIFAVPNGAFLAGDASQRARQMQRLKASGLQVGVPDLCLPVPRGPYHGLWIEMKSTANTARVSRDQDAWHGSLRRLGYKVVVTRGWLEAREAVRMYYKFPAVPFLAEPNP